MKKSPYLIDFKAKYKKEQKKDFSFLLNLITFLIVCVLLISPFQIFNAYKALKVKGEEIKQSLRNGFENLILIQEDLKELDFAKAEENLNLAYKNFEEGQKKLEKLKFIFLFSEGRSARNLFKTGKSLSLAGVYLINSLKSLLFGEEKLTKKISFLEENFALALEEIQKSNRYIKRVNLKAIPEEYRETFLKVKRNLSDLENNLKKFLSYSPVIKQILGEERQKRYLLIFQNNNELRPTGGFMGSFALLDLYQGEIKKMQIPEGGTYMLRYLSPLRLQPPQQLLLVNSRWEIQDANWFPDFPTSARKIIYFFEKSQQPSVDGLITFNATLIPKILEIIGEIEMPEYGRVINKDNFISETQKIMVEEQIKKGFRSREFLADLAEKLFEKVFSLKQKELFNLFVIFIQALEEKEIFVYFKDENIQEKMRELGYTGEIKITPYDYLFIVNSNLAGGKTDEVIETSIEHIAEVQENGEIINTLIISKKHKGKRGDIFTGVRNNNYLRVYVPFGSLLLEATGFEPLGPGNFRRPEEEFKKDEEIEKIERNAKMDEKSATIITEEFGKTVFGNWFLIEPGEEKTVVLKYKLPYRFKMEEKGPFSLFSKEVTNTYSLLIQKQSGIRETRIRSSLILPKDFDLIWKYPNNVLRKNNKIEFSDILNKDKYFAVIIKNK